MEKNLAITQKVMVLLSPEEFAEGMSLFLSQYQRIEKKLDLEIEKMDRKQAAKFLGVSYATMYLWVRDGVLREHGINKKKYFLRSELIEAMQKN